MTYTDKHHLEDASLLLLKLITVLVLHIEDTKTEPFYMEMKVLKIAL